MRRAAVSIALAAMVASSFTVCQARATTYVWTENDRWTYLYPELQFLTLEEADSLWIGWGSDPGEKWLADNVDMTNHGVITWADNNSAMRVGNTSRLTNYGLIDLQAAGNFWLYAGGGGWNTLTNMAGATLRKSTSIGDVAIAYSNAYSDESKFFNHGTLDAQTGRLVYYCPMMYFEDGTRFTGAGIHCIGVSNLTHFAGTITVDPGTTLDFDSRIPHGYVSAFPGDAVVLHGHANLLAGSLQGAWTFAPDVVLDVPAGTQARTDATLENQGVINLRGNLLSWGTTVNRGVIDFLVDDIRFGRENGGWPTLTNEGTIRKSAGTGSSALGTAGQPDFNFSNAEGALIDVQTGILGIYAGNFQINAGDIHVAEGAELEVQTPGDPLTNRGTIRGEGAVQRLGGLLLINEGQITPGDSVGTLTVMGNFVQETPGSLAIDLVGHEAGQFDRLAVTGEARLGGTLVVRTIDGFVPSDGSTYEIVTCAERLEEFDQTVFELGPGVTGEVVYGASDVSVLIHSVVGVPDPGDGLVLRFSARRLACGEALLALDLPDPGVVRVKLFDLSGRQVVGLADGVFGAGTHEWRWSGTADDGHRVGSGVYFARAEVCGSSGPTVLRSKLLLVR